MPPMLTDTTSSARVASQRATKPAPAPPPPTVTKKPPKVGIPDRPSDVGLGVSSGLSTSDKSLAKYLASLFGPAHTDPELAQMASGYVSSAITPQIASLTNAAKGQLSSGADALKQIYDQYAQRVGDVSGTVRADNASALSTEQGAGNALRDYLAHEGGANAAGVAAAGAGEPAGSALANAASSAGAGVGALGAGTAGEAAARGYTGLAQINQEGAAAQTEADKLPGLARLQGEQQLGSFAGQVQGNLKQQEDTLLAQIPGMTKEIYTKLTEDNQQAQQAKATVLNSFYGASQDRNAQVGIAVAGLNKDMTVAQLQALASKYGVDTRAASAASSLTERTAHDKALESQAQATFGVSYQKLKDAEAKALAAKANGGLTADAISRVQREAATDLQTFYHGKPAQYQTGEGGVRVLVTGTGPGSEVQYPDAIQSLLLKYPALGPRKIIQMVNTLYKPGEGGRPALTPKQQKIANQLLPDIFGQLRSGG